MSICRQAADVAAYRRDESARAAGGSGLRRSAGLSNEARQKLAPHRPRTIGQAGRIDGMTPAALTLLVAHLRRETRPRRRADRSRIAAMTSRRRSGRRPRARAALNLFHVKHSARLDRFVEVAAASGRQTTNLVAPSTLPELWTRHVADSLQLLRWRRTRNAGSISARAAAFPGFSIACALADSPGAAVHLVESNQKKAAFLREAVRLTGASGQGACPADRGLCGWTSP